MSDVSPTPRLFLSLCLCVSVVHLGFATTTDKLSTTRARHHDKSFIARLAHGLPGRLRGRHA